MDKKTVFADSNLTNGVSEVSARCLNGFLFRAGSLFANLPIGHDEFRPDQGSARTERYGRPRGFSMNSPNQRRRDPLIESRFYSEWKPSNCSAPCRTLHRAIVVIVGLFVGCGAPEPPSEASKWLDKLQEPPPDAAEDNSWTLTYARFRTDPSDSRAADAIRGLAGKRIDDINLQMAVAIVERDTGRLEEAEKAFANVIAKNPNRAGALWNLGRFVQSRGDLRSAEDYFERSRKSDPEAWQPVYALSQLRSQQGRQEDAKALWQEAKSLGAGQTGKYGGMGDTGVDIAVVLSNLDWD